MNRCLATSEFGYGIAGRHLVSNVSIVEHASGERPRTSPLRPDAPVAASAVVAGSEQGTLAWASVVLTGHLKKKAANVNLQQPAYAPNLDRASGSDNITRDVDSGTLKRYIDEWS